MDLCQWKYNGKKKLDRKTQKKIKKAGCKLLDFAEDSYGDIIDFIN